jgi:hypothetical protein
VSSKCQREFAPTIAEWLKERDDPEREVAGKKPSAAKRVKKKTGEARPGKNTMAALKGRSTI